MMLAEDGIIAKIKKLICKIIGHNKTTHFVSENSLSLEDAECREKCKRCGEDLGEGTQFVYVYQSWDKEGGAGHIELNNSLDHEVKLCEYKNCGQKQTEGTKYCFDHREPRLRS